MIPRKPGQYIAERLWKQAFAVAAVLAVSLVIGAVLGASLWLLVPTLTVAFLLFTRQDSREARHWLQGLRGERRAAEILAPLETEGYRVLHDVEGRAGNIDHVVIGPTGVFAIETKAWRGRVYLAAGPTLMCGSHTQGGAIQQSTREAMEIRRRLESLGRRPWVEAVVALTHTRLPRGPIELRSVTVMEAEDLPRFVRSGRRRLDPQQIAAATAAILRDGAPVTVRAASIESETEWGDTR